jgi:hypothetical protein
MATAFNQGYRIKNEKRNSPQRTTNLIRSQKVGFQPLVGERAYKRFLSLSSAPLCVLCGEKFDAMTLDVQRPRLRKRALFATIDELFA